MQAYANAWAAAIECDECEVDVEAAVSTIGNILVTAATEAYGALCASAMLRSSAPFSIAGAQPHRALSLAVFTSQTPFRIRFEF